MATEKPAGGGVHAPMHPDRQVVSPPSRPLLLYDDDCAFCRKWVHRARRLAHGRIDDLPSRDAASRFPEIPAEELERAVQLVETDGRVFSGAAAVFRALSRAPGGGSLPWLYERVPGLAFIAEAVYDFVARRRALVSKLTRWL